MKCEICNNEYTALNGLSHQRKKYIPIRNVMRYVLYTKIKYNLKSYFKVKKLNQYKIIINIY
jgi:hypothetical protein